MQLKPRNKSIANQEKNDNKENSYEKVIAYSFISSAEFSITSFFVEFGMQGQGRGGGGGGGETLDYWVKLKQSTRFRIMFRFDFVWKKHALIKTILIEIILSLNLNPRKNFV